MTKQEKNGAQPEPRQLNADEHPLTETVRTDRSSPATRDSLYDDMSIPLEKKQLKKAEAEAPCGASNSDSR